MLERVVHEITGRMDESFHAEECVIANTVNDEDDKVFVTLPNSDSPRERIEVRYWQLGVTWTGVELLPRWPERGAKGVVIYLDTGETCLIY